MFHSSVSYIRTVISKYTSVDNSKKVKLEVKETRREIVTNKPKEKTEEASVEKESRPDSLCFVSDAAFSSETDGLFDCSRDFLPNLQEPLGDMDQLCQVHCQFCFLDRKSSSGPEFFIVSCGHILCQPCLEQGSDKSCCPRCRSNIKIIKKLSEVKKSNNPDIFLLLSADPVAYGLQNIKQAVSFQRKHQKDYQEYIMNKLNQYRQSTQDWQQKYVSLKQEREEEKDKFKKHVEGLHLDFKEKFHEMRQSFETKLRQHQRQLSSVGHPYMTNGGIQRTPMVFSSASSICQPPAISRISITPDAARSQGQPSSGQEVSGSKIRLGGNVYGQSSLPSTNRPSMSSGPSMERMDVTPRTILVPPFPVKKSTPSTASTPYGRLTLANMTKSSASHTFSRLGK